MRSYSVPVSGWVQWWMVEMKCPSSGLGVTKGVAAGCKLLCQLLFDEECAAPAAFL